MSAPQADIGHNSGASRKAIYIAEITRAMEARRAKRLEDTFSPKELGALSSSDRIVALKHGLLDNYRVIYALHPNLDVLPGVVLFVSIFSDHGGIYDGAGRCLAPPGCSTYAMRLMAKFFSRSERAIRAALNRAVQVGSLHRHKPLGGKYCHWPVVFRSILDPASSPAWFVDASLPVAGNNTGSLLPVRRATTPEASFDNTGSLLPVRQAGTPEVGIQDHRKPDDNVFPRENILEREPPFRETSRLQPEPPNGKQQDVAWVQTLNPDAAARKAFAVSQVTVSNTGKVTIGPEFRAALREDFTDSQIDRGLEKAARYMEGGPEKRIASVRTACGWAKEDDRKQSAAGARRTFAR
jgi:hypothetical protein